MPYAIVSSQFVDALKRHHERAYRLWRRAGVDPTTFTAVEDTYIRQQSISLTGAATLASAGSVQVKCFMYGGNGSARRGSVPSPPRPRAAPRRAESG